jgi:formylmethanofuran dehydrogenase subunit E
MPELLTLDLQALFEASAARHKHLCPRQILGVRTAFVGARILNFKIPCRDKRLIVISETGWLFC